jgi:non-specific serine/threonine protein kinase
VDHRTDIWAFGCVLYECLTGRRTFHGDTLAETFAATLDLDLDWNALPKEAPERLREVLLKCLERDPSQRLESITVARRAIEEEIAQRALPAEAMPRKKTAPNNLPAQLSSFIGRAGPLEDVGRLLIGNRLVTLTGAGGSGKTRLALELAERELNRFPDGIWLVELASLADAQLLPQTIANALGLKDAPKRTLTEVLAAHVADKRLLLVLDNCEHVIAGCARLADALLRAGPDIQVLATSHEGLGITGEAVYHIPLLSLPGAGEILTLEELSGREAIRLFVDRAAAVGTGFELTEENAAAVTQICRRLDGIPLALELAAARVRVLPVEQIARRLDKRFHLLKSGSKTSLPRHQTLRALIDWSYDLLEEPEQALVRRLSVFAGGWTLDAAEAVCAGDEIDEWEVLDLISHVADRSLVEVDTERGMGTDKVRYRMLETVREYSRDRLYESGEEVDARRRHRDYFVALAEEAEPNLAGADQTRWLLRLAAEHDNLLIALGADKDESFEAELALRLAGALGRYWAIRGHWGVGRRVCAELLARRETGEPTASRAKVLHWSGNLAHRQGDFAEARSRHEEALSIRRALGDRAGVARSLNSLGALAHDQSDHRQSRSFLEESLAIRRELGGQNAIAVSLNNLGVASENEGDYASACALHEESLAIRRGLKDTWGIAGSLSNLGCALHQLGEYATARSHHEESLAIRRELGDRWGIALSLKNLGWTVYRQGEFEAAGRLFAESVTIFRGLEERYEMSQSIAGLGSVALRAGNPTQARAFQKESLEIRRELGERRGIAASLEALGALAAAEAQPERAGKLFGAAETLREEIRAPLSPAEREELDIGSLRETLGEDAFAESWSSGRDLPMDQAVEYALSREHECEPGDR